MNQFIHLVKLSVGTQSPDALAQWQALPQARNAAGMPCHITRMWPKRADEILAGGSMYWVIKGIIQCRQTIIGLDEITDSEGIRRCCIVLKPGLIRVASVPKKAFQGWRYLKPADAPPDIGEHDGDTPDLPAELQAALAEIGVLRA